MQRDAIIMTMAKKTMKSFTRKAWDELLEKMNTVDGMQWWYRCRNLPKIQPAYIYWIVDGKIAVRMDFSEYVRDKSMSFPRPDGGVKHFEKTNWLVCQGPVVFPEYEIPMSGFQGFRYTELIF